MSPVSIPQAFHSRDRFNLQTVIVRLFALVFCVLIGAAWNTASAGQVHVYVTPATASVPSTEKQQFTAKVTNTSDLAVTWSATKGSISSAGLFTAPTVKADTIVSVTATSVADPTQSATAVVTVTPAVSVSISPSAVTMNASKQQVFTATVSNTQQTRVTWSATQGAISGGGMFTSPNVTVTTTVRVSATSVEDPTKSATAIVTVMPPISVTVTPSSASVTASDTLQFTGVAENASEPAVTWSTTLGSISSQGVFTAPAVLVKTMVTVSAVSVEEPTRQAHAKVTVNPPTSPTLIVLTTGLPGAPVGSAYSFAMSATGGFTPYQWAVVRGQPPSGITLSSGGVLSGAATQIGTFPLTIRVTDAGAHRVYKSFNLVISGSARGQIIPATFFGLHINWASTPWPNVPVGSQRLWDTETGWSQINTAAGVYDWTTLDARVHAALAANADVLYDLARTPGWAQCSNSDTSCGSGDRTIICNYANMTGEAGPGQCFPPNDLKTDGSGTNQHWVDWVTAVATRYKGQIKYYEIWNEPTISTMWQGSDAQLVRMTQDAHCIIAGTGCSSQSTYTQTGIDPSAGVTTPAFVSAPGGLDVGPALDNYLNAGGGPYVDVIAFHAYVAYLSHQPELVVSETASVQSVMASYSQQNKPVFNTEGGWGAQKSMPDPDLQASWLARYHILQQSSGLARSYWYSWDGIVTPLWSKTGGTEAGGATFGEIQNWLVGATLSSACSSQGTVWTCGYTRTGGYQALAVWDTAQSCNAGTCTTSSFTIPAGYVYSLDLTGIKTQLSGSTVQIGLKPILLENQ